MGIEALSREAALSKLILFHSEKGTNEKGKNLLLMGVNSFL